MLLGGRFWRCGCGLALAVACMLGAADRAWASTAYVSNSGSGTVTPIDVASNKALAAIKVGTVPFAIAVTPDGKTAYVANRGSNTVTPIDVASNKAGAEIKVGSTPVAIAVTPDGKTVYVSNSGSESVTPIDVASNKAGAEIKVGRFPNGIAITPDGKTAYVAGAAGEVALIDVASNKPGAKIGVGHAPYGVAITPDGKTVYVTNTGSESVTPIDVATNKTGAEIKVGKSPQGVAITPDGKTAYVADTLSNSVTPIDVASNKAGAEIKVGEAPISVAITPDGKTVYVVDSGSESVTPIEVASNKAGAEIKVGSGPVGIAITSATSAADFTWSGAAVEPKWSNGTNWGGTAPKSAVGTLTLPVLTSPGCTAEPFSATCYTSENDASGLEVNAISIHSPPVRPTSSVGYDIVGQAIALGAGGLSVSGDSETFLELPITLAAAQTWSFEGPGSLFGWHALSPVTGTSHSLGLDLSKRMLFFAENDMEVGALTITGANPSDTGSAAIANGELRLTLGTPSLNGTDGNPVHLVDAALRSTHGTFGALTSTGGEVDVYGFGGPGAKFTVAGTVTLDSASEMRFWITSAGTTAGSNYSQLSATGPVNLANAHLSIWEEAAEVGCPTLKPGDVDTLITTTGSLTGTFSGVPDGATIPLECRVETIGSTKPTVKINYTAHTVTATVQELKTETQKEKEERERREQELAAKRHAEEEAVKKKQEEELSSRTAGGGVLGTISSAPPPPVLGHRQTARVTSGTVLVRAKGASSFTPLSASSSLQDGSEIDATNGRVVITAVGPHGEIVTAEVYGGRFRIHQDANGETHFILTLPLTGCPRIALPKGSAAIARARHRSGPRSRHLWVSETGGKWGTNGRFVSTSVEGTTWLTLDECTRSEVKVAVGKVQVHDLVRSKTKTVLAGHRYVASAKRSTRRR